MWEKFYTIKPKKNVLLFVTRSLLPKQRSSCCTSRLWLCAYATIDHIYPYDNGSNISFCHVCQSCAGRLKYTSKYSIRIAVEISIRCMHNYTSKYMLNSACVSTQVLYSFYGTGLGGGWTFTPSLSLLSLLGDTHNNRQSPGREERLYDFLEEEQISQSSHAIRLK